MVTKVTILVRVSSVALLCLAATACGSGNYDTTKIKQYKLSLVQGDTSLVPELKQLVEDYNNQAGIHVLDYTDDPNDANSPIIITQGLESSSTTGDIVGYGQWLSETKTDSPYTTLPGQKVKQTITYSMRVQFDQNYLKTNTHYANQKLFFHEVGHGLEMEHIQTDPAEVMYPFVDGDKNFPVYFERVRSYMADL